MTPNIIFINTEMKNSDIMSTIKSCKDKDTVVVYGKSEHNFSEIPKLTVGNELDFAETYPDPDSYEELPPEPTCPPSQFGMNKVNKRKKKFG